MGKNFEKSLEALSGLPEPEAEAASHEGGEVAIEHPSVALLRERFGDAVLHHQVVAGDEHVVFIRPDRTVEVLRWLKEDPDCDYALLADLTAVDYGGGRPIQVVYQLWSLTHRRQLRVIAELPLDGLEIDTAVPIWHAADWLEREVYDLFGVRFRGHPDLRRIMMPDGYAEGHPLRKDFPLRGRFSRAEQTRRSLSMELDEHYIDEELEFLKDGQVTPSPAADGGTSGTNGSGGTRRVEYVLPGRAEPAAGSAESDGGVALDVEPELEGEHMLINIGPQHPATHGVLRLVLELDGETVVRCIPHIGYLHSSFEKLGEYRDWNQIVPLTDRMDYLSPLIYNCAYVMAVEKLMGMEVTERCKVLRVICMELDRIFSHLLWLGTTGIDVGAFTVFLWTFQERERIYDLHEAYTGARITTSATRVGGMMADLPAGWTDQLAHFIDTFPRTLDEVDALLTGNQIWIGRLRDVGVIGGEDALNYGLTGPNLRASGVDYDVRKDRPYYDYETYDFDVPVGENGDSYDRYLVRMEEMRQSLRILRQALDRLPDGPINVDDPRTILPGKTDAMNDMESMIHHFKIVMEGVSAPPGESWYGIEGAKGELGMYVVSDGGSKPVRWRIRGPSFINLAALPKLVEGHLLADVIAINASLDIVLGEIDR